MALKTLLRSGCSSDTSPPVGFLRRTARTRGEPLRSVHECVFGVLALESEPVDPRL